MTNRTGFDAGAEVLNERSWMEDFLQALIALISLEQGMRTSSYVVRSALSLFLLPAVFAGFLLLYGSGTATAEPKDGQNLVQSGGILHPPLPELGDGLTAPAGAPSSPSGYLLPVRGAEVSGQAPRIAAWNRTALPDESFTVTGSRFTLRSEKRKDSDTSIWLGFNSGGQFRLRQLNTWIVEEQTLTATVPSDIPYGLYFVWIGNEAGVSAPFALNKPRTRWIGPLGNTVEPGETKRIFGRALSRKHARDTTAEVWLRPKSGGDARKVPVTKVNPFAVTFRVPASLSHGTYDVYHHAGHGGEYGIDDPLTLEVNETWERGESTITVEPEPGNDANRIQAAIDKMSDRSGGGTVQLQEGRYVLTDEVVVRSGVALAGNGPGKTRLETRLAGENENVRGGIRLAGDHVVLRDFKSILYAGEAVPRYGVLANTYHGKKYRNPYEDWTVRNVHVRKDASTASSRPDQVLLGRVRGLEITNCTFEVSVSPRNAKDVWIHDNQLRGAPHGTRPQAAFTSSIKAMERMVLEHNDASDRQYHLQPPGDDELTLIRFINFSNAGSGVWPTRNLYIAHNTGTNIAPNRGGDMNKGELILFHHGGTLWRGQVASHDTDARQTTIRTDGTIDGQANGLATDQGLDESNPYGKMDRFPSVTIVSGTGMGQTRYMAKHTGDTFTVQSAWRVPPDQSSVLVIRHTYEDAVVYDNSFSAFPKRVRPEIEYAASNLVQVDGGVNIVAEHNEARRTHGGLRVSSGSGRISFWNTIRGNSVKRNAMRSIEHSFKMDKEKRNFLMYPVAVGNRFLGNRVQTTGPNLNNRRPYKFVYQIGSQGGDWSLSNQLLPPVSRAVGNVFEHNRMKGQERGILAGGSHKDLFRNNEFELTDVPTNGKGKNLDPSQPVHYRRSAEGMLWNNGYTPVNDGDPTYSAETDDALVPRPYFGRSRRYVQVSEGEGQVLQPVLRNTGVAKAAFRVSSNRPWLSVETRRGRLAPESATRLRLTIDPSSVPGGLSEAVVSVEMGDRVERMSVIASKGKRVYDAKGRSSKGK